MQNRTSTVFIGRNYVKRVCHKGDSTHGMKTYCKYLEITSEFDEPIKITDIKVNRGNCHIFFFPQGAVLKWGQSEVWSIGRDCNVREATIETDRGSQTLRCN